ncbi:hypothetical protein CBER1_06772 [Cercospora berteroae]|uniref:Uncharacterized protein n=1 Tax=Cercospora berteroae TaxID=357750 RepID=A0A2S6BRC0_9PEZI|nr:hypothetical protein CBER1_06772 [Cercospora berteroae]
MAQPSREENAVWRRFISEQPCMRGALLHRSGWMVLGVLGPSEHYGDAITFSSVFFLSADGNTLASGPSPLSVPQEDILASWLSPEDLLWAFWHAPFEAELAVNWFWL